MAERKKVWELAEFKGEYAAEALAAFRFVLNVGKDLELAAAYAGYTAHRHRDHMDYCWLENWRAGERGGRRWLTGRNSGHYRLVGNRLLAGRLATRPGHPAAANPLLTALRGGAAGWAMLRDFYEERGAAGHAAYLTPKDPAGWVLQHLDGRCLSYLEVLGWRLAIPTAAETFESKADALTELGKITLLVRVDHPVRRLVLQAADVDKLRVVRFADALRRD